MNQLNKAVTHTRVVLQDTMDAQIWVQEWMEIIKKNPTIPHDEGTMLAWFSGAIMTGYDHGRRQQLIEKLRKI